MLQAHRVTEHLVRVVLGGPGLAAFEPSVHADSYVKLAFCAPGPRPLDEDGRVDLTAVRDALGPDAVRLRAYTVRDARDGEVTLDVVVHGDEGLAGPWAARLADGRPREEDLEALVLGPGGAWSPVGTGPRAGAGTSADTAAAEDAPVATVLVGDASALPAVAVCLERMPADATGVALVEVAGPADRLPLTAPAGVEVRWVEAAGAPGDALVAAVRELAWPAGRVEAFVHGEAQAVRALRRHVRAERGVRREDLSASGYWRQGVDDEGWRAQKRDWVAAVEADDAG